MIRLTLKSLLIVFAIMFLGTFGVRAANGDIATTPIQFAHEIAEASADLNIGTINYPMGVARVAGSPFVVSFTLSGGAVWANVPTLVFNPTVAGVTVTYRNGGNGSATVEYDVNVDTAPGLAAGDNLQMTGAQVNVPGGDPVGATFDVTISLRDLFGAIDTVGDKTEQVIELIGVAVLDAPDDTATTVDAINVTPARTAFVVGGDDTALEARATVTVENTQAGVMAANGVSQYVLVAGDVVTITINGDFTGLDTLYYDLNNDGNPDDGEIFDVDGNTATLSLPGDILGAPHAVAFLKTDTSVLTAPRTFGISAHIEPASDNSQDRDLEGANSNWWQWQLNATTLFAPYITFSPGNATKFRFTNGSDVIVTVLAEVKIDAGNGAVYTAAMQSFDIPANSATTVELNGIPTAGTGAQGPLGSIAGGQQPVRGSATFIALTATNNVSGQVLIASPVGVITILNMYQSAIPTSSR